MIPESALPKPPARYRFEAMQPLGRAAWGAFAVDPQGRPCFLKLTRFVTPDLAATAQALRLSLMEGGGVPGLIGLRDSGLCPDSAILWEALELADRGDGSVDKAESLSDRLIRAGAWSAEQTLALGVDLCRTLKTLHGRGFLHGDVKPANILFVQGRPVLADLGSLRALGQGVPPTGTPGYLPTVTSQPVEVDLVALGKSLYEVWTGEHRYQFPSLPPHLGRDPEWSRLGWRLNRVLLHTADPRPSRRLCSAAQMESELLWAGQGGRQWSRREVLSVGAPGAVAGLGFFFWRNRPEFGVRPESLPPTKFGSETWNGSGHSVDWSTRSVYSLQSNLRLGLCFQRYSFETWKLSDACWKRLPPVGYGVRDPEGGHLWATADVSGELIRLDTRDPRPQEMPVAPFEEVHFTGPTYWNPITRRPGRFSGYGSLKVVNRRWEWDAKHGAWMVQADAPAGSSPLPRTNHLVVPGRDRSKLWFFGGEGNSSGQQGVREPGLRGFNGSWHVLDDLWQFDLATGLWRNVLPLGGMPPRLQFPMGFVGSWGNPGFAELSPGGRLVIVRRSEDDSENGPSVFVIDPRSREPHASRARLLGPMPPLHRIWTMLAEPERESVLVFANRGVFRLSIVRL